MQCIGNINTIGNMEELLCQLERQNNSFSFTASSDNTAGHALVIRVKGGGTESQFLDGNSSCFWVSEGILKAIWKMQLLNQFSVRTCILCIVPRCDSGTGTACRIDFFLKGFCYMITTVMHYVWGSDWSSEWAQVMSLLKNQRRSEWTTKKERCNKGRKEIVPHLL